MNKLFDDNIVGNFTYGSTPSPTDEGEPVSNDARGIRVSGNSIFPESTRIVSAPIPADEGYSAIFSGKSLPHAEPFATPGGGAGIPSAPSPRSSGLGNSAIGGPLPGWTE